MCTMEVLGMDVLMEDGYCEHEHSGCSSTSTIDQDDIGCWNDWSPVVDWGPFCADASDIHGLIESMICDNINNNSDDAEVDYDCDVPAESTVYEPSSTTTSDGTPPRGTEDARLGANEESDDKGLRLVHLLMAAAEALTGACKSRDLARVILVRLKELVSPAAASGGTNMERLAAHFTDALQGLLDGPAGTAGSPIRSFHRDEHQHQHQHQHQYQYLSSDVLAAFQLLQDMSPYMKFGHFTANQAILESVSGERRVHIIDYDIMEGVQWASLMQAMVSQKNGPPPPHLRVTAITRGGAGGSSSSGRKAMGSVQETGRRLVAFAESIGQPFSFGQCRLEPDGKFRTSAIKLVKGETVIANCILHPPHIPQHRSAKSVASFLAGAAALSAKLITLVEEEGEIRKGEEVNGFVGQFMDELHRYSAIWDSLEAGFPMQGRARRLVEQVILGPRIACAIARGYRQREEMEGDGGWGDWMTTMGFGRVGISFFSHCQARLLLGLFNDGYRVEEDAPNKLVLGWKSCRLISVSIWSSPLPPSTTTIGLSS